MQEIQRNSIVDSIAVLVTRARRAQEIAESFTQERVDELCAAVAWNIVKDGPAQEICRLAVQESGMGEYESKYAKLMAKVKGTLRDMKGQQSVGIIEEDKSRGLLKIAKPVGVVGGILPITNNEATPVIKAMAAIKTRSAIIEAPHPRAKRVNTMIVDNIRATLRQYDAPEDLVQTIAEPSIEASQELMRQVDLVIATGGSSLVSAAYRSGTPAYGVGQGNAMVVIDETADLRDAANKIMRSKTFDHATSCSTENSLCIQDGVYDAMVEALQAEGGYLCNAEEKARLQKVLFRQRIVNPRIMGQHPQRIAQVAGIDLPEDRKFYMVEETGIGPDYPLSSEKISVIITLYRYGDFSEAIDKVNEITSYQGKGHSCGIHSFNEEHILELSLKTKVGRIMIRQPQCLANSGAWTNGMPMTMSLACGTWGRNITSENIDWRKYMNMTWVSYPIASTEPTDEELFGDIMYR